MNITQVLVKAKKKVWNVNYSPVREGKHGKFIFIHINKTGGTSVAEALGMPNKSHLTVVEIIDMIGYKAFEDAYSFTVVRNPWSKVLSHYKFRVKTNQTNLGNGHISFNEWVKKTYGKERDKFYFDKPKMFKPQVEWLKDEEGKLRVHHYIKFENLDEDYKEIASKIGASSKLRHLNATSKSSLDKYYNDESIEIVRNWFREDIELFGYNYNG